MHVYHVYNTAYSLVIGYTFVNEVVTLLHFRYADNRVDLCIQYCFKYHVVIEVYLVVLMYDAFPILDRFFSLHTCCINAFNAIFRLSVSTNAYNTIQSLRGVTA